MKPDPTSENSTSAPTVGIDQVRQNVIAMLKTVYDPEIPVNIYELGLIYRVDVSADYHVDVDMTLTSPACPEAQSLPQKAEQVVQEIPEVKSVTIHLVWEPPWTKDLMSEETKLLLGMF